MSRCPAPPPLIAALLFALTPSVIRPLWGTEIVTIEIHHIQHQIVATGAGNCGAPTGCGLTDSPTIKARKEREVRISITDPNPLLFDYSLQKGEATQTANAIWACISA